MNIFNRLQNVASTWLKGRSIEQQRLSWEKNAHTDPENFDAHTGLVEAAKQYLASSNPAKAKALLESALALDARHEDAVNNYIHALIGCNELKKAHEHIRRHLSYGRRDRFLRRSDAHVCAHLGKLEEARDIFADILTELPDDLETQLDYGQVLVQLRQYREALSPFLRVLEREPVNAAAWFAAVNTLNALGELPQMLAVLAQSAASKPIGSHQGENLAVDRFSTALLGLLPDEEQISIVDGGARDAMSNSRWANLPMARIEFFGFEPDPAECQRLNNLAAEMKLNHKFFPVGLWSGDKLLEFEDNNTGGGSSFLRQNREVTDRWRFENANAATNARDIFFPKQYLSIATTSLDKWAHNNSVAEVDFVKLNVQGGELEILKGAETLLQSTLGILVEVSFVESYHNRPFFADIDIKLRNMGFTFFDLIAHHYVGRAASPVIARHLKTRHGRVGELYSSDGQLIEGHALYLRDPIAKDAKKLGENQLVKLCLIANVYGQIEFAFEILQLISQSAEDEGLRSKAQELARRPGIFN